MPDLVSLHAIAFRRHGASAILDDVENFPIGKILVVPWISEVADFQLHVRPSVAFPIAIFPVAHGAVDPISSLCFRKRFRRRLNGIGLSRSFRRDFVFGGGPVLGNRLSLLGSSNG